MGTLMPPTHQVSNMGMKLIFAALSFLTLAVAPPSPTAPSMNEGIATFELGGIYTALIEYFPLADQVTAKPSSPSA